ncbi:hypothetical protein ACFL6P_04600 [Candidatus Latescibacterota bacterium]
MLDDWPKDIIRYPIVKHRQIYGPTDIDNVDLTDSSDLTPEFIRKQLGTHYVCSNPQNWLRTNVVEIGYTPSSIV